MDLYSRRKAGRKPRLGQKRDESKFVTRQSVTITSYPLSAAQLNATSVRARPSPDPCTSGGVAANPMNAARSGRPAPVVHLRDLRRHHRPDGERLAVAEGDERLLLVAGQRVGPLLAQLLAGRLCDGREDGRAALVRREREVDLDADPRSPRWRAPDVDAARKRHLPPLDLLHPMRVLLTEADTEPRVDERRLGRRYERVVARLPLLDPASRRLPRTGRADPRAPRPRARRARPRRSRPDRALARGAEQVADDAAVSGGRRSPRRPRRPPRISTSSRAALGSSNRSGSVGSASR